ncbi:hypothetical protein WME78_44135 [Sorangium sp. So ce1097]
MAKLRLDLRHYQPPREPDGEGVVRQPAELADPPLHPRAPAAEHADVRPACADEVNGDLLGGAEPERLRGDLRMTVHDDVAHLSRTDARALAFALRHLERVGGATDPGAMADDVQGSPLGVRRIQPHRRGKRIDRRTARRGGAARREHARRTAVRRWW